MFHVAVCSEQCVHIHFDVFVYVTVSYLRQVPCGSGTVFCVHIWWSLFCTELPRLKNRQAVVLPDSQQLKRLELDLD